MAPSFLNSSSPPWASTAATIDASRQQAAATLNKARNEISQTIRNITGMGADVGKIKATPQVDPNDEFPGQLGSAFSDYFWGNYNIEGQDFNQSYNYQMVIHGVGMTQRFLNFWLNPTAVDISVPVAVNTQVTMRGVVEDYNGAPLRRISIRGVAGIIPSAVSGSPAPGGPNNLLDSMFKNTIQAANRAAGSFNKMVGSVNTVISGHPPAIVAQMNHGSKELYTKSGYYWIHSMVRMLDGYLEMKKQKRFKNARFCFCMHKDKMYWDCTLNGYSIRKVPGTMDYEYTIDLTAWRRRPEPPTRSTRAATAYASTRKEYFNQIAAAVNTIRQSRQLVANAVDVLNGIRSDVQDSLLGPARELCALGKDIANAAVSLYDFPATLRSQCAAAIFGTIRDWKINDPRKYEEFGRDLDGLGIYGTSPTQANPVTSAMVNGATTALDTAGAEVKSQSGAETAGAPRPGDPLNDIFNNQEKYAKLFDNLNPEEMRLSAAVRARIDEELDRIRRLTVEDFQKKRDRMQDFVASVSESFGGGSVTYNRINGLPAPKTVYRKLSVADIVLLSNLNDLVMAADKMISTMQDQQQQSSDDDYALYYGQMARENGIAFEDGASKFMIPFPYDATLEQLAVQYLGDADRWIEIAAINGLRPPYIDETGFSYAFLGSGAGNSVVMSTAENLYVGQPVVLSSDTQSPSPRTIKAIDVLSSVEVVLTFDGEADLSRFNVTDNAKMKAFLPNTVNSLRLIAIPSDQPVNVPGKIQLTPGLQDINTVTLMAKRDWLLTSSGDLSLLGSGDIRVASGLTNLTQAATMKLMTPAGAMLNDPKFGNPVQAGVPVSELSASDVLRHISEVFADDDRFGPVLATRISIQGPAAPLDVLVNVNGTSLNLPFTTQLPV